MDIAQAKQELRRTIRAYTAKTEDGVYRMPRRMQRPVLLMGPPGIGKTAILSQLAQEEHVGLVCYTMTHHTRQSALGLPVIVGRTAAGKTFRATEYTMSEIIASVYEQMEKTGLKRESCSSTRSTASPRRSCPRFCRCCRTRPSAYTVCRRAGSSWPRATRRATTSRPEASTWRRSTACAASSSSRVLPPGSHTLPPAACIRPC